MKNYTIRQRIHFSYGHRMLNYDGPCKHVHGHNGLAEFVLSSEKLDSQGMVRDFTQIKSALKTWIDENLDHCMLLRQDDPLVPILKNMDEPVFSMKQNPTAETIAQTLFEAGEKLGMPLEEVTFWETPNQSATYRKG